MEGEEGRGLPASIARAWGLRDRPTRGPKPGLSLEAIVAAGVRVAAADGLAAVTMGRVAVEAGTAAMSLYRYVATKDELLALMVDAVCGLPPAAPTPDTPWRAGLERWGWDYRAILQRHPWVLRIPISGPPITPNQIAWLEEGLRALRATALAEREKLSVMLLLSGFVRNEVAQATDIATAALATGTTEDQAMAAYGRLLGHLIAGDRFPALWAVIAAGVMDEPDSPDEEFVFGLARVLDGVESLIRERASAG